MRAPRTRRGRPTKAPPPGEKASLGLRVTATLKLRLEEEARRQGRSQSEEAEARIERTFDRQALVGEALEMVYGRQTAGLLMLLGEALRTAGGLANAMHFLARGSSPEILDLHATDFHGQWLSDPRTFDAAVKSINSILESLRPVADVPPLPADARFKWEDIADYSVAQVTKQLHSKTPNPHWEDVRSRLGTLVKRPSKAR